MRRNVPTGTRSSFFAVLALIGTMGGAAMAAPIPADMLALDHQRCMKGCVPGFGEETCKQLCDCTVDQFQKQMDFSTYLELSSDLTKAELRPAFRKLLDTVANQCASEVEKSGTQVGAGVQKGDNGTLKPE